MSKYILKSLVLAMILMLGACQSDSEEFVPGKSPNTEGNNIFGVVVDESDNPIENARVVFNGTAMLTDQFGIYQFKNVSLDARHNFVNITLDGYFETTRTFRTRETTTVSQKTKLIAKDYSHDFTSNTGGTVDNNNISIDFPADAIMYKNGGGDYSGNVQLAMHFLDPTADRIDEIMPGDMSAVDADNVYSTLNSFGMVYVEMRAPNGDELQIKTGMKATMTGKIPADVLADAPSSIKMWYFDNAAGLWIEEGSAQLVGDTYVGEVAHFSCWNYDGTQPTIILCGRVIDENGNPLSGVHVWVESAGIFGIGHGNTNADGTFCGAVTKDKILTISIRGINVGAGCNEIHVGTYGPYAVDTDLGDIVVIIDPSQSLNITGTALACAGGPLTNGVIIVDGKYFQITDGTFDVTIPLCTASGTYIVKVVDVDASLESDPITVSGAGTHPIGVIDPCTNDVFHLEIKCDALMLDLVALKDVYVEGTGEPSKYFNGHWEDGNNESLNMFFVFTDGMFGGIALGQHAIINSGCGGFYNGAQIGYTFVSGTVTITAADPNAAEPYVLGSYMTVLTDGLGNNYDFYGTFKLHTF